ncbi:MAG: lipopolysaccharide biosynthesis protein [Phycisphaerales bacterium]|nr:lipopolysaccharide biosynthesis protein [Phycisphaerales bacterium]MCB9854173.1 lipopolysaccharide biosynthesis protein [Phycisphaerales bacterium]MCB9864691.1 lipopolysaccharide biosynthesis protein [Phycisphaerales bacterium]
MTQSQDATPPHTAVSRRRATQWNILFGYGMLVLTVVRNFLLVPIFFKYIGALEYKAWLASGAVAVQLLAVDFGLMGALSQMVASAYGRRDHTHVQKLVGTGLVITLAISFLLTLIGCLAAVFVPGVIGVSGEIASHITWAFLIVSIANGIQLIGIAIRAILNSLQRPFGPGIHNIVGEILALIVTVVLLLNGFELQSIAIGMLLRAVYLAIANGLLLLYVCRGVLGLSFRWDRALWPQLWRLSAYQFLAQLAGRINISFPTFLIAAFVGPEAAGSFALTSRAHDMIRTITFVLGGSLNPAMAHLYGEGNQKLYGEMLFRRARVQFLFGAIGIIGVVALNEPFMRLWVGDENFSGQLVNCLIGISVFVGLYASISYDALYCMGALRRTGVVVILESFLRLAVMIPLLATVGVWGVPFATAVVQFWASVVPFCLTLQRWFAYTASQLRGLASKIAVSTLVPLLALIPVMMIEHWISSWSRFLAVAAGFSVICGAFGFIRERNLIREIRRPRTATASVASDA